MRPKPPGKRPTTTSQEPNLLYSLNPEPAVYFVDCDAMRIRGVSLSHQVETPGWEVPAGEPKATVYSDRYKLGLLALRLLVGGQDGRDPNSIPSSTPAPLSRVIADTLTSAPEQRPPLKDWDSALVEAIASTPKNMAPPPHKAAAPPVTNAPSAGSGMRARPAQVVISAPQVIASRRKTWPLVAIGFLLVVLVSVVISNLIRPTNTSSSQSTSKYPVPSIGASSDSSRSNSAEQTIPRADNPDLGLPVQLSRPSCDGTGIVVLGSATTPGRYREDISRLLNEFPGASYLRTDISCPSLRRATTAGDPIYAVFRFAGRSKAEVCAAVAAAGRNAYGKWLDSTSDPNKGISCGAELPQGDLGLSVPMSRPACDGTGIVILGSVTTPGRYREGVAAALSKFPGASYLRTDMSCPSLRQADDEGDPIYAIYQVAGRTSGEVCAAVVAAGGSAYGRWLDYSSDPSEKISC